MQWRVVVELLGADDEVRRQEVYVGGSAAAVCSAETLGLRLEDLDGVLNRLWEPSRRSCGTGGIGNKAGGR